MNNIVQYLIETYSPLSLIVYGSYAEKTQNKYSDFDALVITENHEVFRDNSFVGNVQLDVYVYPLDYIASDLHLEEFLQIFDGKILWDTDNLGLNFKNRVLNFLEHRPQKSRADINADIDWCQKMLLRTKRQDAEGMFRRHWLLVDSLEIFCDAVSHPYLGPKKTLSWMEERFPAAFKVYSDALFSKEEDSLNNWVCYLTSLKK
jgi:predicted nucleotidyltransferase